jgi:hypothetical protein
MPITNTPAIFEDKQGAVQQFYMAGKFAVQVKVEE